MTKKKIEIIIEENGDTSIEAFGFKGGECRLATKPFEEAAGAVKERVVKDSACEVEETVRVKG